MEGVVVFVLFRSRCLLIWTLGFVLDVQVGRL